MNISKQKIALVTGANSGLGKEIALGLAKSGAHVIMVCRNLAKGTAALAEIKVKSNSDSIDLLIADLSSQAEIRTLAKTIAKKYPKLNILINNAALVLTQKTLSVDNIEMTLATNYLGPFLLNNLLIDLLKKNAPARIVNVSSAIQKWAKLNLQDLQYDHRSYQALKAYAQSKLLVNIMTVELARKLAGTGVTVNAVHPGAVKTALGSNRDHGIFLKFLDKIIKLFFISPQKAAKSVLGQPSKESLLGIVIGRDTSAERKIARQYQQNIKKGLGISLPIILYDANKRLFIEDLDLYEAVIKHEELLAEKEQLLLQISPEVQKNSLFSFLAMKHRQIYEGKLYTRTVFNRLCNIDKNLQEIYAAYHELQNDNTNDYPISL